MECLQVFWLRAILRFWNDMRSHENALVVATARADLRLVQQRNGKCWSYVLCRFLAELGQRTGAPIFAEPYQSALLGTDPLPDGIQDYLWQHSMHVENVCCLLDKFWRRQVLQVIGDDPRVAHCPHPELTEFVHNTGLQPQGHGFGMHLRVAVDKQACIWYMRFRQNRWQLNAVTSKWSSRANTAQACPHCGAATEDRKHVVFECPKYSSIRNAHHTLFTEDQMHSMDLASWLNQHDQVQIVACINSIRAARFIS
jgi:hypothetical protein